MSQRQYTAKHECDRQAYKVTGSLFVTGRWNVSVVTVTHARISSIIQTTHTHSLYIYCVYKWTDVGIFTDYIHVQFMKQKNQHAPVFKLREKYESA